MSKQHVIQITDAVGAAKICAVLGVTHHSVRFARSAGVFPARWYGPLSALCAEAGVDCPLTAFNWVTASPEESENA